MKIVILERVIIMVATWVIVRLATYGLNYEASLIIATVASISALFVSIYYSKQGFSLYGYLFYNRDGNDEEEHELYAQAEQECDSGNVIKGLWSKAIVNAKGNEEVRKIEYMKLRVAQLRYQK